MTLRTKLISLILLLMVPAVGIFGFFYLRILTVYQNKATQNQRISLRMIIEDLDEQFDITESHLHSISHESELFFDSTNCSNYLTSAVLEYPEFTNLLFVNKSGDVLCSTPGLRGLKNLSDYNTFQQALLVNGFHIGELLDGGGFSLKDLPVAYPVKDLNGSLVGILLGTMSPDWLESIVQSKTIPEGSEIYIVDQDGTILFSQNRETDPVGTKLKDEALLKTFHQAGSKDEAMVKDLDQTERQFLFAPLEPQRSIILGVGLPVSNFITDTWKDFGGNIALLIIITLSGLTFTYFGFENAIVKPMNALSITTDKLANGQFSVRIGMQDRKDEFGRLSQNFDRMAKSLEEQLISLENESNEKLASQEEYFRLFEDSILGIFKFAPQGGLMDANPALVSMLGFTSAEELISSVKKTRDLFQGPDSQLEIIQTLIAGRQPVNMEVTCITKDGKPIPCNMHMWGVWNPKGELQVLEGLIEDISVSKQTQTQLKKLGLAVEQNPIGIIITDGNGCIEYANPSVSKVYGLPLEEIISSPIRILLPKDTSTDFISELTRKVFSGDTQNGKIRNWRKNGEEFWCEFKISPIVNEKGQTKNSLILIEDVTLQHRNQEHLTALRTIDLAISSNMDLSAILNIIINQIEKELGVDAVSIQKFDDHFHMLHSLAQIGFSRNQPVDVPFPASADMEDRELIQDFSIFIPNDLGKMQKEYCIPFPKGESFHCCYGLPLVAKSKILGVIRVFKNKPFDPDQQWMDYFYNLGAQTAVALDNNDLLTSLLISKKEVLDAYDATIAGWSKALEFRDEPTEKHSENTTGWTMAIARKMGFTKSELEHVWRGAKLHDIGKFNVPDVILRKEGPLSDDEWVLMKEHPRAAFNMLKDIEYLKPALDIPYCHHERWDGTGYPRGLKGEEIPLSARIFAVIDVFDAMIQDRPYRKARPLEDVIQHLRMESGKQFDPEVIETFLTLLENKKVL